MNFFPNKTYKTKYNTYFIGDVLHSETEVPSKVVVKDDGFYCFDTDLKTNIQEEHYYKTHSILI